ncbi:Crp/Fnr family transcriptional regulator [Hymenobacter swuensis]|uniref:Transcriptional regulator, Crp/Fnr family n=1 Tax=Hymenobacter swuensis DY53 TaxID=1227739 RepID=W8F1G2_9BACT|nr:Crp/Fnr family transcriptional regulator [Hymenobacter swuensis]AHJ95660.1 transcriptional regulator, Crp/Fnr family [Hymenobacter swuensis DY53]
MQQQLREHLEQIVSLTDEEFALVQAQFTSRQVRKHQFLIREGEQVREMYFVVTGLLKLVHTDAAGRVHVVSFAQEDWWEGDFAAYLAQTPATLSLQCLEDTAVWCLPLAGYEYLCRQLPQMARFFLVKFARGGVAAQQRILSLLALPARERYELLLRQYPRLPQRVSKTLLAAYLGVSRETLSRLAEPTQAAKKVS